MEFFTLRIFFDKSKTTIAVRYGILIFFYIELIFVSNEKD